MLFRGDLHTWNRSRDSFECIPEPTYTNVPTSAVAIEIFSSLNPENRLGSQLFKIKNAQRTRLKKNLKIKGRVLRMKQIFCVLYSRVIVVLFQCHFSLQRAKSLSQNARYLSQMSKRLFSIPKDFLLFGFSETETFKSNVIARQKTFLFLTVWPLLTACLSVKKST